MNALLRRTALAGLALLLTAASGGASAGSPSSVPNPALRRPGLGPVASPAVLGSGNLVNHGGSLESTSTNYLIFWGMPAVPNNFTTCGTACGLIPPNVS